MIVSAILTLAAFACSYAAWPALRSRKARTLFVGLALGVFALWMGARWLDARLAASAGFLVSTWVGASLVCVGLGVTFLAARAMGVLTRGFIPSSNGDETSADIDESRRRFLGGGVALPGVAFAVGTGGAIGGSHDFLVKHVSVPIANLPKAFDGFRIGQITDVHIGDFITPQFLERAVETMNDAGVHLQVMTGDLIDDLSQLDPTMLALLKCRAPYGMLAVLGNHEKFRDEQQVLDAYARHSQSKTLRLLVDESVVIEHDGQPLRIVGVDYPMRRRSDASHSRSRRLALMEASANKAFSLSSRDETVLCLSHHPEFFPLAAERGAALTLAGHTHGGQVAFLGRSLLQTYDFMLGRYQRGNAQLYVSGGTGHWLPFRIGVPTEVTILTLRAA